MAKIETTHYIYTVFYSVTEKEMVLEEITTMYDGWNFDDILIDYQTRIGNSLSITGFKMFPVGTDSKIIDMFYWDLRGRIENKDYLTRMGLK